VQRRIHWLYSHAIALNICHRQRLGVAGYIKSLHMACMRHLQTYIMYFPDTSAAETRHEENCLDAKEDWQRKRERERETRRKYPTENQPRLRNRPSASLRHWLHVIWSSHSRSSRRDSSGDFCVRSNAEKKEIFNVMIILDSLETQASCDQDINFLYVTAGLITRR